MQYTVADYLGKFALCALLLGQWGCSTIGFYGQAALGQLEVMTARQSVATLIDDADVDTVLRQRLQLSQSMLGFAESALALPVEGRYQRYADLGRDHVVYNVVAAPALSLRAKRWCYPVVGCAPYRGYFRRHRADALAQRLSEEGFEVSVSGAAAYSTLGWFDDPLLNTFIGFYEGDLADLLFHELAHSAVWIRDDVRLNESFASFVGQRGALLWLADRPEALDRHRARLAERRRFRSWSMQLRRALRDVYAAALDEGRKASLKAAAMAHYRACYEAQRTLIGDGRYDRTVAAINNARLALLSTYDSHELAFARLLDDVGGDWGDFYARVRALGELDEADRAQRLGKLSSGDQGVAAQGDHHDPGEIECEPFPGHAVGGEPSG